MNGEDPFYNDTGRFRESHYESSEKTVIPWEAMLAYVPVFCIYSWAVQDVVPGVKQHARQGMILFVIELLLVLLRTEFVYRMVWFALVVIAAFGVWSAFQGIPYRLPLIADFVERVFGRGKATEDPPLE